MTLRAMTPCEEKGWKVGDMFEMVRSDVFGKGDIIELTEDDGTRVPQFKLIKAGYGNNRPTGAQKFAYACLSDVKPVKSCYRNHTTQNAQGEDFPEKSGITFNNIFYPAKSLDEMYALLDALHTIEEITQDAGK